jgi:hypothetical protein
LKSLILKRFKRKEKEKEKLSPFSPFQPSRPTGPCSFPRSGTPTLRPFSFFLQPLTCRSHLLDSPSIPRRPLLLCFEPARRRSPCRAYPLSPLPFPSLNPIERQSILMPLPLPFPFRFYSPTSCNAHRSSMAGLTASTPPSASPSPLSVCLKPGSQPYSLPFTPAHTFSRARAPNPPQRCRFSFRRRR